MAEAQYSIMVPTEDNLGNPLVSVADYAHQVAYNAGITEGSTIEKGSTIGKWRDDPNQPHDVLSFDHEDTPEMDSFVKQLAKQIGEMTNQWGIYVRKYGSGFKTWTIDNPNYREGEPAEELALAPQPTGTPLPASPQSPGRAVPETPAEPGLDY